MITRAEEQAARAAAVQLIATAGFTMRPDEIESMEVADFGLSNLAVEGAAIATLVQTERISMKLLVLTPWQTEPEHWHPPIGTDPGKEETVRHLWGDLYFYLDGPSTLRAGRIPTGKETLYSCRREIVLAPNEQLTLEPGAKHWFQGGPRGAVLLSISTVARDILDKFSDPAIVRQTVIGS